MPCSTCRINDGHNARTCNLNLVKKVVDKFNKYIDEGDSYSRVDTNSRMLGKAILKYLYLIYTKGFVGGDTQFPQYIIAPLSVNNSHYIKINMRLLRVPTGRNGQFECRKPLNVEHAVTYEVITNEIQGKRIFKQWMTYYFIPNCYGNITEENALRIINRSFPMNYHLNKYMERLGRRENVVNTTNDIVDLSQSPVNNVNVINQERERHPRQTSRAVARPRNENFVNDRRRWILLVNEAREAEIEASIMEEGLSQAIEENNYDAAGEFVTEIDELNTIALDRRRRADILNENNRFNTRRHQRTRVSNNDTIRPPPIELCSLQEKIIETDECPICMDKIGNTNKTILRCGHQFCVTCLFQNIEVISKNKQKFHCECPICRGAYYNLK